MHSVPFFQHGPYSGRLTIKYLLCDLVQFTHTQIKIEPNHFLHILKIIAFHLAYMNQLQKCFVDLTHSFKAGKFNNFAQSLNLFAPK
ncbi:hypothetical protein B9T30_06770 [Acinetobacter sp. ANC 4973]|nr:hypothetical protein B9T30_06770 [Acinetobacter sp. ANC 4973]